MTCLAVVEDPRIERAQRHELQDILKSGPVRVLLPCPREKGPTARGLAQAISPDRRWATRPAARRGRVCLMQAICWRGSWCVAMIHALLVLAKQEVIWPVLAAGDQRESLSPA